MRVLWDDAAPFGATVTTESVSHGARGEGWRGWEGILRARTSGDSSRIRLICSQTGEAVVTLNPAAEENVSSAVFQIPNFYRLEIDQIGILGVLATIVLDGDTGRTPKV